MPEDGSEQVAEQEHPHGLQRVRRLLQRCGYEPIDGSVQPLDEVLESQSHRIIRSCRQALSGCHSVRLRGGRQSQGEFGAAARPALDRDVAVEQACKALAYRKAQPGSLE